MQRELLDRNVAHAANVRTDSAVPNRLLIATERNEDAAWGRSLTHCEKPFALRALAVTHQPDRAHLDQNRGRTPTTCRLRLDDARPAKGRFAGMNPVRVLVQQEPEIGRRLMSCGDRQQPRTRLRVDRR